MLVLSRKKGETIVITLEDGRRITLMVVEIRGDKVRLGCNADQSIVVHRGEIQRAIDTDRTPGIGEDYA